MKAQLKIVPNNEWGKIRNYPELVKYCEQIIELAAIEMFFATLAGSIEKFVNEEPKKCSEANLNAREFEEEPPTPMVLAFTPCEADDNPDL